MVIDIEVRDVEHLIHVLTAVEADSDVAQVLRKTKTINQNDPVS